MSELLSVQDFSSKIKEKYPEYKDVDDLELTNKIIEKYPEYKDKVNLNVTNEPSAGEVVGGLAAEVALAEGMKYAGAAGGATLGSVVPVLGTAVGGTIGYTVGAISGGITGSIAAQKIEGREDISWGRVIGDTLLNFIPASKVFKGGSTAVRVAKTAGTQAAAGAAIAPTSQAIESYVDTGEIPDVNELAGSSLRGAALGAGLGATSVGVEKLFGKLKGKKITDVDTMVATGDLTFRDFKPILDEASKLNKKLPPVIPETRGLGKQYHGTSGDLSSGTANMYDHYSSDNIYGQGFYTTDAVDIARGYSKKGKGENAIIYNISEKKPVKFFDLSSSTARNLIDEAKVESIPEIQDALDDLPINASGTDLYDWLRNEVYLPKDEIQEIFYDIQDGLMSSGYGGITHIGGAKTGNAAHNVKIYFDPKNQINLKEEMRFDVPELDQLKRKVYNLRKTIKDLPFGDDAARAKRFKEIDEIDERIKLIENPPKFDGLLNRELELSARKKASEIMAKEALVIDDVTKANIDQANEIAAKSKGSISKLYASLVPSKVIGRESNQAAIDFKRSVVEYKEIGSRIAENVKRNIKGDKELNDQLNRLLDGEPVTMTLNMHKKFGADIRKYQEVKLDLQHKMLSLIDEGAYKSLNDEARERLQDTIQDSIAGNSYNRREYKLFLDKNFKQDPKLKKAAFDELAAKMGAKKAKEHMDKLENASAATKAADVREFYGSAVDSIMKRRHEVGAAERAWLGEVTDAPERIRGTLEGVGKSVARAETDLRIQQSLVKAGLAAQEKGEGMVSLRLRGTGPNGTGLYVNPEVQVALNQVYLPNVDKGMNNIVLDGMVDFYRSNLALSKASKVLLNTISYPVQVYGNMTSLAGMAINPFKGSKRGAQLALAEFGTIERLIKDPTARKALLDDIQDMSKYGIKGSNIIDSDIRSTLEDGVFNKWLQEGIKIKGKQVTPSLNFFGKAYSVPDTMGRYVGWKANQSKFRKIFPNASDETIKKYAAISINDTYQNYDKLSNVIKTTSKWGVIPQFASFTMEFSRNQYNQGKTIAKMLSGKFGEEARQELGEANYAEMAKEGSRRLAALSAVYAGTYGLVEGVKAASGIDKEKDDALRNLAYSPWDKNKQMMVYYDPKTRKGWTADPSYVVPHAIGMSAFQAGLNGEDEASLMSFIAEQVIGEGSFVMQSAFRALTNTNKSGKEITNEIDKLKAGSDKLKFYLTDAFKTGAQKEYEKFTAAREGRGDLTLQQVFQRQVGIRKNSFDLNESAMFSVMNNYNHGKNAAAKYYSALKYKDLSKEQYQAEYEIANRINKESFNELLKNNEAMAALGYTEEERINIMRDAKVSSEVILSVLGGKYVDLPIAKEKSTGETYDELTGTDQEKIKQIGKLRSTDPTLAKKLMNKHRSEIRMKRKGINVKDELIKNLDTIQKVNYFKNNRGLIPEYRKKGIISNEVLRALETTQ